jgi:hypothetical protein
MFPGFLLQHLLLLTKKMKKISLWDEISYACDRNSIFKALCLIAFIIAFFVMIFNQGYLHMKLSAMSKEGVTTGLYC